MTSLQHHPAPSDLHKSTECIYYKYLHSSEVLHCHPNVSKDFGQPLKTALEILLGSTW